MLRTMLSYYNWFLFVVKHDAKVILFWKQQMFCELFLFLYAFICNFV